MELDYNNINVPGTVEYALYRGMDNRADELYNKYDKLNAINCAIVNRMKTDKITLEQYNACYSWLDHSNLDVDEIIELVFEE